MMNLPGTPKTSSSLKWSLTFHLRRSHTFLVRSLFFFFPVRSSSSMPLNHSSVRLPRTNIGEVLVLLQRSFRHWWKWLLSHQALQDSKLSSPPEIISLLIPLGSEIFAYICPLYYVPEYWIGKAPTSVFLHKNADGPKILRCSYIRRLSSIFVWLQPLVGAYIRSISVSK